MTNKIAKIIATFFGSGLAPKAPGTMGSLASLPLAFILINYNGFSAILAGAITAFIFGVWAIDKITKNAKDSDPAWIVIDETAGQLLSFALVANYMEFNFSLWWLYPLGFAFFRLFDILKIGPVKWADTKLKNAYGVMLDDVFAGLEAAICLYAVYKLYLLA